MYVITDSDQSAGAYSSASSGHESDITDGAKLVYALVFDPSLLQLL